MTFLLRARGALETAGYGVLAATDGESALTEARSNQPDVVLVDSRLPSLDGLALLARLRDDPLTADIPVLFASTRSSDHSRALDEGARIVLGKPVAPSMLVDVLARVVDPPCVEAPHAKGDPLPESLDLLVGSR
ncbi:MAG TPA: response regulator [Planctomycetaceae bacterium]|nr:response regulator [Planctomycetaceae bacterium]